MDKERMALIKEEIKTLKAELSDKQQEVHQLMFKISKLTAEHNQLDAQLAETDGRLKKIEIKKGQKRGVNPSPIVKKLKLMSRDKIAQLTKEMEKMLE